MAELADIALIGLAVMGQNLILNMNDKGFKVCAFNRTVSKVNDFLAKEAKGTNVIGASSLEDMVSKLKKPARIILLVMAGAPVDDFIEKLIPLLSPGDIIIDGGNSDFHDSIRRYKMLKEKSIEFVGCGVSGGEEGARYGPSMMPGGSESAWVHLRDIFSKTAAHVKGVPCCTWIGSDGAGHFVKMVHNGIEYGDMQLICEAYFFMKEILGMTADEMADVFDEWNKGDLESYLIEITRDILRYKDEKGEPLVEKIYDSAGQKGTGKWTVINALQLGSPVTLISEAVFARCLSALKTDREVASASFGKLTEKPTKEWINKNRDVLINQLKEALYASKLVSYAQGFMLISEAAKEYGWNLNMGKIALIWRGGCIIRSRFLENINLAYEKSPKLNNLLLDDFFKKKMIDSQKSWRSIVTTAVTYGIPVPAFSSALSYFDGYTTSYLPANLLQAHRDYFGAHTYELLSQPGKFHHTKWTGRGGDVSSTTYQR